MTTKNKPYPGTQAILRAISLLDIFSDEQPDWHLAELAKVVNLNRSTLYRLLSALESFDLVMRDPVTDRYRLGSGLIALGGRALRANPVRSVSKPELEKLVALTGETATLEVLAKQDMLIVDEILGDHLMSGTQSIGTRWPAFATSTGQAIMAYLPPLNLATILQPPLPAITSKTVTVPEALQQQLTQIRKDGYAVVAEALELGFIAIGAPIHNYDDHPIAAISLGGPTVRLTKTRIPEIGALVRQAAKAISTQLGYRS